MNPFSFGIIVQELIFEQGPAYTHEKLSNEEKIQKLLMNKLNLNVKSFGKTSLSQRQSQALRRCLTSNYSQRYPVKI